MPPPLITHLYTADPSAHVFEGRVYIYPSHDRETDITFNDNGDQYDMADYHVFSTGSLEGPPYAAVTDHGAVLRAADVPWASKQLWAPDAAASRDGRRYYLYFPARDRAGVFRVGVAVGPSPAGPFAPDPEPIPGSFSIDPASFVDPDTGAAYLYFGGLWGGQLQCYQGTVTVAVPGGDGGGGGGGEAAVVDAHGVPAFDAAWQGPKEPSGAGVAALCPKVAPLADDMRRFAAPARDLVILAPETGEPLAADDHARRFFEAAWVHKRRGRYYFSYSTGDTHFLVYAVADDPLGPFTYAGRILEPVLGWTTHHSIVEFDGRWWLFYHDCEMSKGVSHLRNVKVAELFYDDEGKILPVQVE
ncbi:putative xylosidase arabinosidase [Rosellinia necatrix]|uniref:Putative xylosidase arabinosidase n=1 Tax=Rosellinia necatrix TaxID=77044 RepID=A0A1W2TF20_ROSNE|nr:putative xylosidase arabinosidase [Rosellinia necatrix]